jgi:hypothetical protein
MEPGPTQLAPPCTALPQAALAGQAWCCGRGPCLHLGRSATAFHAFPLWLAHGLRLAPRAQAAQAAVDLMDGCGHLRHTAAG